MKASLRLVDTTNVWCHDRYLDSAAFVKAKINNAGVIAIGLYCF